MGLRFSNLKVHNQFRNLIMKITNKKATSRRKKTFFLISAIIAITSLVFFLLDYTFQGIIAVGVISIWYLYFHVADFQYIEYIDENKKIILRFYKAISFGKQEFSAIEFPQQLLKNAHFSNSIFGKMTDLTFSVKTKRGIADYPSVSLSAVPFEDRLRIRESLNKIIDS